MRDARRREKGAESHILASIVGVQVLYGFIKMLFNQGFEVDEGFFDLGFLFKRIEPCISGKMVNKYEIILEVIDGEDRRSPYISIQVFKGLRRSDCICIKSKFMTFITETMRTWGLFLRRRRNRQQEFRNNSLQNR